MGTKEIFRTEKFFAKGQQTKSRRTLWGGITLLIGLGVAGCGSRDGVAPPQPGSAGVGKLGQAAAEGEKALAAGDWERAIDRYSAVLATDPNQIESLYARSGAHLALGRDEFLRAEQAAEANQTHEALQQVEKADAEFLAAETDCRAILAQNADFVPAHYLLGCINIYQGEWDGAIADFSTVLRLDPNHAAAYQRRGEVYGHIGDTSNESADLTRAAELGYGGDSPDQ